MAWYGMAWQGVRRNGMEWSKVVNEDACEVRLGDGGMV